MLSVTKVNLVWVRSYIPNVLTPLMAIIEDVVKSTYIKVALSKVFFKDDKQFESEMEQNHKYHIPNLMLIR